MFAVAWGGNEFTPLLVMYKAERGMSTATVDVLLAAYVLGIIPALLLGGPLSDRLGRRRLMVPAPLFAIAGSVVLALAGGGAPILFCGRVLSGIALGLVMAVGTAWVKELSQAPYTPGPPDGRGARRAGLALTVGFGLGAGAAAALAQFLPHGDVFPYLLNAAISAVTFLTLLRAPETRFAQAHPGRLADDLKIPASRHRRFLLVVLPAAPWVFGCAASAYAIMPTLVADRVGDLRIGFSGLLCLVALGCGFGIQTIASRFDTDKSARGTVVALAATTISMGVAAVAAWNSSLVWAAIAAAALGVSYGLLLVAGLEEIQRIAGPDDLAGLTAVYYSLTYLGFFIPAILAGLDVWFSYAQMFAVGSLLALISLGFVSLWWSKHLPSADCDPESGAQCVGHSGCAESDQDLAHRAS